MGVMTHESCGSGPEIRRRLGLARSAFGALEANVWSTRLALVTKVRLYNSYVLPVLLYGAEAWAMNKEDERRVNAFGMKCLRSLCGIKWSDFITNKEVHERTGQANVSDIIRKRRLSLLGHIARMPGDSDVRMALLAPIPEDWKRQRGRPKTTWLRTIQADLEAVGLDIDTAVTAAGDRVEWRKVVRRATLP